MTVVPLLPCASIEDMLAFYTALGFEPTYRQAKPNPYLAMRRGDIDLGFFGMPGFNPADSYGSCIITVPDTSELHRAFADGLRSLYGKVPLAGIPRMTRPRPRRNAEGLAGFSVVDPGGNWLRIYPEAAAADPPPLGGESWPRPWTMQWCWPTAAAIRHRRRRFLTVRSPGLPTHRPWSGWRHWRTAPNWPLPCRTRNGRPQYWPSWTGSGWTRRTANGWRTR